MGERHSNGDCPSPLSFTLVLSFLSAISASPYDKL
jgi:hypothetical protein